MKGLMLAMAALVMAAALWGGFALAGISSAFASPLPADEACAHAVANAQATLPFNTCVARP